MDCPPKWTINNIIIFLLLNTRNVISEHTAQGVQSPPTGQLVYRECAKESPNANASPTPQLLNTLLTIAAANGVLPDLLPKIQPLGLVPDVRTTQEAQKQINVAPTQQLYQQSPVIAQSQSIVPKVSHTNPASQQIPAQQATSSSAPVVSPIVISPGLNQVTQQTNSFVPPSLEFVHPPPLIIQPQAKEEVSCCPESVLMPGQISRSQTVLPAINGPIEMKRGISFEPVQANSILTTKSGQSFPVNLQISIPPPNVEAPRITFINAPLPPPSVESSPSTQVNPFVYPNWFPYGFTPATPPQPIIVKKKKSSFKDWLPLILLSMLNNDRGHSNNGGCCCCPCKSGRGKIPVPFPIPIPTNNPIINTGSSHRGSSRNRGSSDECDDDWLD